MTIAKMMSDLASALPEGAIREVSLTLYEDGGWHVAAGGHPAVALGEWQGDFYAQGKTPEDAISACMNAIQSR